MTEYQAVIEAILGRWGWLIAVAIGSVAFKDTVGKFWQGIMFLIGNDFNVDDIVWINGVKKARIVRQSIYKTTFYLYDHHRKFVVPNDRIWLLNIEKKLPTESTEELSE
jgi:hypothetical protein